MLCGVGIFLDTRIYLGILFFLSVLFYKWLLHIDLFASSSSSYPHRIIHFLIYGDLFRADFYPFSMIESKYKILMTYMLL